MTRGLPVSILLHLLVLGALATWGGLTPMEPIDPRHVLQVQLATLPEPEPEPLAMEPESEPEHAAEPETELPEEAQPSPPEPEVQLPPKEVPEPEPEPEPREPEPEPQPIVPEPEPEPVETPPAETPAEPEDEAPTPTVTEPTAVETDEALPPEFNWYLRTVRNNVARNWQPKQLGFRGRTQRSCAVHFVIGRGGQVSQVTIVRRSGVPLFDREALRAVQASRMPPLPSGFASPSLGVTFTFTLESGV